MRPCNHPRLPLNTDAGRFLPSYRLTREHASWMLPRRSLFSSVGIRGATTREIALEKAGVNEVTLFRHFGSRRAALTRGPGTRPRLRGRDDGSAFFLEREPAARAWENTRGTYYSHIEKKERAWRGLFSLRRRFYPQSMQTMIAEVIRPVRESVWCSFSKTLGVRELFATT